MTTSPLGQEVDMTTSPLGQEVDMTTSPHGVKIMLHVTYPRTHHLNCRLFEFPEVPVHLRVCVVRHGANVEGFEVLLYCCRVVECSKCLLQEYE